MFRKLRLISKSMTSPTGKQIGNQKMKFGQLMECNMRIFFSKSHTQNVMEKLVPYLFPKIKIEHISGSTGGNFIQFAFIVCPSPVLPNILKLRR